MVDLPAYLPYFSSKGFIILFWATICKESKASPEFGLKASAVKRSDQGSESSTAKHLLSITSSGPVRILRSQTDTGFSAQVLQCICVKLTSELAGKDEASAYLTERALHASQEVIVAGPYAVSAVDVVHLKSQLLYLLKVVVQAENLPKEWMQVALDHFCPVQLREGAQLNETLNLRPLPTNTFKHSVT